MDGRPQNDAAIGPSLENHRSIARWPQMVPVLFRKRWRTARGFSFHWSLPVEQDASPVEIVMRNHVTVFEVLDGAIEVTDGLERVWSPAGSAVAVSIDRFLVTPSSLEYVDVQLRVHIIGTIPFGNLIFANEAYLTALKRFDGTLPGIFELTGSPMQEVKPRKDPGEAMVGRYSQMIAFLRFLASSVAIIQHTKSSLKISE